MKKTISLLLTVLLLASLCTAAMADEGAEVLPFEDLGFTVSLSTPLDSLEGIFFPMSYGALQNDPDLYYMLIYYFAMSEEDFITEEAPAEGMDEFYSRTGLLCSVIVSEGPLEDYFASLGLEGALDESECIEFGTFGDLHYTCLLDNADEFLAGIEPVYAGEFTALRDEFVEALKNAELYAPFDPGELKAGSTLSFTTTDLDGVPVTSEELFASNEITMINYWGTWCHFCVEEMAELAQIHTRLQEKGCGIIGILQDGDTDETLALARQIMDENGTNYPTVLLDDSMFFLDTVSAFPTSFFVDSSGTVLCDPVQGAVPDRYEAIVDALLSGMEAEDGSAPAIAANGENVFRVTVTDPDGAPVEGAWVQFCDESTCNTAKTGADGVAVFELPEGTVYTAHIFKVPAGYEKNPEEFETLDVFCDIAIVLSPAA